MVCVDSMTSLSRKISILTYKIGPYGGIERMLLDVAKALQLAGCNVQVLSVATSGAPTMLDNIQVFHLKPKNIWASRIYSRSIVLWLTYYLGKLTACDEIILVGHLYLLKYACRIAKRRRHKVWLVAHGIEIWPHWSSNESNLLRQCDVIVAVSQYTAQSIIQRLPDRADRVVVIPNMVNTKYFTPCDVSIKETPRVILTVGRIAASEGYKGHDLIIKSISGLEKRLGVAVQYRIVGDGDDKGRLQNIASSCGVSEKVLFLGYLDDDALLNEYQKCHVFAMPSYVSRNEDGSWTGEGFGIVYIEAAACGKPVLACDTGGQIDCVRAGETGLLVEATVKAVETGLYDILKDLKRAHRMGTAGRILVGNNFSREVINTRWASLLYGKR